MIHAFASNGTNGPLDICLLAGGSRGGQNFLHSHVGYLPAEVITEDGISIAQQVSGNVVKEKRFAQLLSSSIPPLGGRSH